MVKYRKSQLNGTTMIEIKDIPKNRLFELSQRLCELKRQKDKAVEDAREFRVLVYNLSMQINEIIDNMAKQNDIIQGELKLHKAY